VAERRVQGWVVVCTAGEPNLVVDEVLGLLAAAGGDLRYHGDFDWPGLALAERAVGRHGLRPWLMGVADYLDGVAVGGPPLVGTPVEPSWDPELGAAMRHHGHAVHEETVLPRLLDAMGHGR
jgi:uncharacterized protein (TIGR02679 family)